MQDERNEGKEVKEQVEKKQSPLLKIIVIVVLLGLLGGGGAAGYFFLIAPKLKSSGAAPHAAQEASQEQGESGEAGEGNPGGSMKPLDPFVVNLTDGQGTRYLKAVVQLEMDNEALAGEIDSKMPQIRDEIIMLLSSKSFDDLSSTPGKRALKRGMVESVNKYLSTGKVVNVFFSDFVIQ